MAVIVYALHMANRKDTSDNGSGELVRTSILVKPETDRALRDLADAGHRPLSWEIRAALEAWVEAKASTRPGEIAA